MHAGRWVVVAIVIAAAGVVSAGYVLRKAVAPRSIVLVTIDTLRADRLGVYGRSPSLTPQIDALAGRGVVFESAWTTAPITVPAHATLLTGLLPPKHGLRVNEPTAPLPPQADRRFFTLAEVLREQGYATGAFVSSSVLRGNATGLSAGFDVYDDVPPAAPGALHDAERPGRGEETVEKALAWARSQDGSMFLWVHLFDPHAPYDAPVGWGAGASHTADAQGYDAEVAYADHCVGRLVKGLADSGRGDVVVAVTADHGEGLGEHGEAAHGFLVHEATLHVPLIVTAPGLPPGRERNPVSTVDLFPTLLAIAGQSIPPQVNGAPLLAKGTGVEATRKLYAESIYGWHACRWAQTFALRRGDVKIVASGARTMVFDLSKDPKEEHPAAPDAEQREAASQLLLVACEAALATMRQAASPEPSGGYWGGGVTRVLSEEENATLPSPYERMDILARFDAACGQVAAGRAKEGLTALEAILREDPGNLETAWWRGRALEALARSEPAVTPAAAAAYRRTYEMGLQTSACVSKALHCSWKAVNEGAPAEWALAIAFLADARGRGTADDAATLMFEAMLHLHPGHEDLSKAEDCLRRADAMPAPENVRKGLEQSWQLLRSLRK